MRCFLDWSRGVVDLPLTLATGARSGFAGGVVVRDVFLQRLFKVCRCTEDAVVGSDGTLVGSDLVFVG